MYIVIRHSEAGSLILTRHDNFNAILDEMKLDMEYAYLKEYGGDIKLKDSDHTLVPASRLAKREMKVLM